jgi:hypothetical protein
MAVLQLSLCNFTEQTLVEQARSIFDCSMKYIKQAFSLPAILN